MGKLTVFMKTKPSKLYITQHTRSAGFTSFSPCSVLARPLRHLISGRSSSVASAVLSCDKFCVNFLLTKPN